MNSETSLPGTELVKCCNCGCSCSVIDNHPDDWTRAVKRKIEDLEISNQLSIAGFDYSSVARVQVENECEALRETVASQQQSIQELYEELEEERNASSSATNEAMSMILRLQTEKAEVQMEARQFKRYSEEKMAHDQQELVALEDLLYKREEVIQSLGCEVQAYKHRLMSYGYTEAEVNRESGNVIMDDEGQFELLMYDYPPLKCKLNEYDDKCGPSEVDYDVEDIEKIAFGESPHAREELKNLEFRISQMEGSPRSNQIDLDSPAAKHILEKVIVGQSPKRGRSLRQSSSSLLGVPQESRPDFPLDSPMPGTSFKKMDYATQKEDHSNLGKTDNRSDFGDDASDRVYTVDSIHNWVPHNDSMYSKAAVGFNDDIITTPRKSLNLPDVEDPGVQKLHMRLQALEADRESMKQAIISMSTDKAQLVLLKEIAQQLSKNMSPERPLPVRKTHFFGGFSFVSIVKWAFQCTLSLIFRRHGSRRNKNSFGLSASNVGLLMLLNKDLRTRHWRCLTSTQV